MELLLEFNCGTAGSLDGSLCGSREGMGLNVELALEFTDTENLDKSLVVDESSLNEFVDADGLQILLVGKALKDDKIDSLVLHTVDVLETMLGKTTLERHLTTFKTNLLAIAGACLSTLVTTSGGTAHTRAGTTANALAGLYGTLSRLEIMQFHIVVLRISYGCCLVYYFYQVVNLADLSANAGIVLEFNDVVKLLEAEGIKSALLGCRSATTAYNLLNLDSCHID